eukprot:9426435-Karenia_brevis.AAC.1
MLRDANRTFKEKFENAYAAAKWIEKSKKQRTSENPDAGSAPEVRVKKEQERAEVRPRNEQRDTEVKPEKELR